jgi:hypothetical protein
MKAVPVRAFVLDFEVGPRSVELRHPVVGHEYDVRFAHDELPDVVKAVVFLEVSNPVLKGKEARRGRVSVPTCWPRFFSFPLCMS